MPGKSTMTGAGSPGTAGAWALAIGARSARHDRGCEGSDHAEQDGQPCPDSAVPVAPGMP
jgi:hypothetical protein